MDSDSELDSVYSNSSDDNSDYIDHEEESDHLDSIGEVISDKYIIIKYLGYGTFSRVWLAFNPIDNQTVVMKLQHAEHIDDAKDEYEIIRKLKLEECESLCQVTDGFEITKYGVKSFAFVMEILGISAHDYIRKYKHFTFEQSKKIMECVIRGLDYIHKKGFMHTDIKTENILFTCYTDKMHSFMKFFKTLKPKDNFLNIQKDILPSDYEERNAESRRKLRKRARRKAVNLLAESLREQLLDYITSNLSDNESDSDSDSESYSENIHPPPDFDYNVKLADFGGTMEKDFDPSTAQTRNFRALEVILGETSNEKIDIWSLGPVFFELLTGNDLFELGEFSGDNYDTDRKHVSEIIKYLGKIPDEIYFDCENHSKLFTQSGKVKGFNKIHRESFLDRLPPDLTESQREFTDNFIRKCCTYNPKMRPSATDLLLIFEK